MKATTSFPRTSRALLALALLLSVTVLASAQTLRVTADQTNLRDKPSVDGAVVAALTKGAELEVIERDGTLYRVRVRASGREGYVNSLLVEVASPAPAPSPTPTAPPKPPAPAPAPAPAPVGQPARPASSSIQPSSSSGPSFGVRGFGTVAIDQQNASESFKAVAESATTTSFGGGLQLTNVWAGLFIEVGVERTAVDGERVFLDDAGAVHRLGIPVKITMTPLDVMAGWRFGRSGRVIPYAAAGFTSLAYEETSDFASGDENVKERAQGAVIAGGVEVRLIRWLHVRGEARYRHVPGILGEFGVSKEFEEKTLGGFGGAVKIVVGR